MSAKTGIEWTDSTWNPIRGVKGRHHCTKISPGCQHCYAAAMNKRFSGLDYVKGADTFRLDEEALRLPLIWRKPRKIFVCSMTDLFHEDLNEISILLVFGMMAKAAHHTFQVLTKRPSRMARLLNDLTFVNDIACAAEHAEPVFPWPLPNVWLGVTTESQQYADERIPLLLQTPAAVRFVSYEPALGPVDLKDHLNAVTGRRQKERVDWVICGGESGPGARPIHPDWARSVRDQCQVAGVSFFMKQMDKKQPIPDDLYIREFPHAIQRP